MTTIPLAFYILAAFSGGVQIGLQFIGVWRLRAVAKKINGVIRSRSDLDLVRNEIQANLYLGIPIICNCFLLIATFAWAFSISTGVGFACTLVLGTGQVVAWKMCRPIEQRFKAMPVESEVPGLLKEYQSYVRQWAGATLFLKPPK
jgi:hypothetical protein